MQAIAATPGSSSPKFVAVQQPDDVGPDEVLCRTLQLGVCGTDREILLSQKPLVPSGEPHLILGHECLAEVVAVGSRVTSLSVGDLVVPTVRRRRPDAVELPSRRVDLLPFGTYVERGIVWEHGFSAPLWLDRPEHLFVVPPDVADVAILTEPMAVAEKGVHEALAAQQGRLGNGIWQDVPPCVLVTGQGPIAFTAILACIVRGWPVTVYGRDDPDTFRSQLAQSMGAQYEPAQTFSFTPSDFEQDGFDLVLECTGSDDVAVAAAGVLRSCGVFVWLGSSRVPKPTTLNVAALMRDAILRNHLFLGTVNAAERDFKSALAHLAELDCRIPSKLRAMITARVTLEEALPHYVDRIPQGIKSVVVTTPW